ncbi:unnamed protein product [Urochloa humidicola]
MGKLLCDPSAAAVAEALPPSPAPAPPPPLLAWHSPAPAPALEASTSPPGWDAVWALEDQQRRRLLRIWERGVAWKPSPPGGEEGAAPAPVVFRLDHGGEVDADGNCLFTAARTAAAAKSGARELRHRVVRRFAEVYGAAGEDDRAAVDAAVRHLYAPDLKAGWGVHVVQEIKVLAPPIRAPPPPNRPPSPSDRAAGLWTGTRRGRTGRRRRPRGGGSCLATGTPRPHMGHGSQKLLRAAQLRRAPPPHVLAQRARHLPLRREGVDFCIPSLLQRQFALPFASSVGELPVLAQ